MIKCKGPASCVDTSGIGRYEAAGLRCLLQVYALLQGHASTCSFQITRPHPQIRPLRAVRPGVGVAAGGGQALVAEGVLHAAVGRVVAWAREAWARRNQWGDVFFDTRRPGGPSDDAPKLAAAEPALCPLRTKHCIAGCAEPFEGFRVAKGNEDIPGGGRASGGRRLPRRGRR
jgi:hypothetical protein